MLLIMTSRCLRVYQVFCSSYQALHALFAPFEALTSLYTATGPKSTALRWPLDHTEA